MSVEIKCQQESLQVYFTASASLLILARILVDLTKQVWAEQAITSCFEQLSVFAEGIAGIHKTAPVGFILPSHTSESFSLSL